MGRSIQAGGWVRTLLLVGLLAVTTGCGGSEARKARHVEQGQKFMAERNFQKARIEFRNAQQIDPKDANVRSLVGLSSEKLGEYDDAVKAYRVAIATDGSLLMPRARLARILAIAGVPEEAEELVTEGLSSAPDSAELLSVRALIYAGKGNFIEARRDAEQALKLAPTDVDVIATLVSIEWQEGKRDGAVRLLDESIRAHPQDVELRGLLSQLLISMEDYEGAERQIVELIRLEPGKAEHRSALLQIHLLKGNIDEAIEVARGLVETDRDSVQAKMALTQLLASHRSMAEADAQLAEFRRAAPEDHELLLAIGRFYEFNGRNADAEALYRSILQGSGRKGQGLAAESRLAALSLRSGNIDEAAALVAAVLKESPSDADALVTRAEIALQRGDAAAAVADLRVAFGAQPDSVSLAVALARAHVAAGETELAEQVLRSVVQSAPGSVEARFELAQFLVDHGKMRQARPIIEQLVNQQPNNLAALRALSRILLASGDAVGALNAAQRMQALQPGSQAGYVQAGEVLLATGDIKQAEDAFRMGAARDSKANEPVEALVRLYSGQQEAAKGLALVDERLASDVGNARLQNLRGDLLVQFGRSEDAVAAYRSAISAAPKWVLPYRGLAAAFFATGQGDKAVEALQAGLKATGGSILLSVDLATLYQRIGKAGEALKVYEALFVTRPGDDMIANNLAMLLTSQGDGSKDLQRAESIAERFKDSANPAYLDTYGWVLYRKGRHSEATEVLSRASALAPQSKEILYHLGMAQLAVGQRTEAKRSLQSAVSGNPTYPGLTDAKSALATL
jgi:predicted Zn-dependent protease